MTNAALSRTATNCLSRPPRRTSWSSSSRASWAACRHCACAGQRLRRRRGSRRCASLPGADGVAAVRRTTPWRRWRSHRPGTPRAVPQRSGAAAAWAGSSCPACASPATSGCWRRPGAGRPHRGARHRHRRRADARGFEERPSGFGVEVIPGVFTIWNLQDDPDSRHHRRPDRRSAPAGPARRCAAAAFSSAARRAAAGSSCAGSRPARSIATAASRPARRTGSRAASSSSMAPGSTASATSAR